MLQCVLIGGCLENIYLMTKTPEWALPQKLYFENHLPSGDRPACKKGEGAIPPRALPQGYACGKRQGSPWRKHDEINT